MADVAEPAPAHDDRRQAGAGAARSSQVENGAGDPGGHVQRPYHGRVGGEGGHVGAGDVENVDEIAGLPAVLEHPWRLASFDGGPEDRCHAGVRRVLRHPGSVDIVVTQGGHGDAVLSTERGAEVLLVQLGGGVDVAWVGWRLLADGCPPRRATAGRAAGIEAAGGEVFRGAGAGSDIAVASASVTPLAVDHHARRQHQPTRNPVSCRTQSPVAVPESLSST